MYSPDVYRYIFVVVIYWSNTYTNIYCAIKHYILIDFNIILWTRYCKTIGIDNIYAKKKTINWESNLTLKIALWSNIIFPLIMYITLSDLYNIMHNEFDLSLHLKLEITHTYEFIKKLKVSDFLDYGDQRRFILSTWQ